MSATENKAIVRRFIEEAFNKNNTAVIDEVCASDYTHHDSLAPSARSGPAALKEVLSVYHTAFPDMRLTIDEQVAEGDKVVTRWSGRGTHRGELMGLAPTGRPATVTGIQIDRITGGKFTEGWVNWDPLGLLPELGAIRAPAKAGATARSAH